MIVYACSVLLNFCVSIGGVVVIMSHQAKLGSDAVSWILPALASFSHQNPIKVPWAASKGTNKHIPIRNAWLILL